jgi:hypothetical protein
LLKLLVEVLAAVADRLDPAIWLFKHDALPLGGC